MLSNIKIIFNCYLSPSHKSVLLAINNVFWDHGTISPDSASIILRSSNYSVTFVVESTGEDIISVTFEHLAFSSGISVPHTTGLITTCGNYLIALWIELNFRYFVLMPLQQSGTGPCEYIIHSCYTVSRGYC